MGGILQIGEVAQVVPEVDLSGRVVYFPVRHHSPACALHVDRLIRELKPDAVLIEGPRDATPLVRLLTHADIAMPVAVYTTYVRRRKDTPPERYAAYYPLCDYSPELSAIRAAAEVGAAARFIDLTFPEQIEAEHQPVAGKADSLLEERRLTHSRLLRAACGRSGARDPDDLWDHLYEVNCAEVDTPQFMRNVLAYCALARQECTKEMLAADGCLAREAAMAAAVAEQKGRVVAVTGGFHTVALPTTAPQKPKAVQVASDDAQTVLMAYGFEQLDRLNGYASGMPSPEFYQRVWEGRDVSRMIVELRRRCDKRQMGISTADCIAALDHVRRLARLRGHEQPSREDLLDGVRSVFVKGSHDIEGVPVLALARKMLAGHRVGKVPAEAGLPPIVGNFRQTAAELRLDLGGGDSRETVLDLYRKAAHRTASRFFHQLRFLGVPFAERVRGPDFVHGENLDRIQEAWKYHWSPRTESTLIERSLYGSTVEEAAAALLLERFDEAEKQGQGRRADVATALVLEACSMGLHRHSQDLLRRTGGLIAEDHAFDSLVLAMEHLLALEVSREPLEAHHLEGLKELAVAAYRRACYVMPEVAATAPEDEHRMLDAMNGLYQAVGTLGDTPDCQALRWAQLYALLQTADANAAIQGGAAGLLFGDGQIDAGELVRRLRGHLHSTRHEGADGPNFLRGLLRTARSALWLVPECITAVHEMLRDWEEEDFIGMLPLLRLALADLTPGECHRVARAVAAQVGVQELHVARIRDATEADLIRAARVNHLVRQSLARDGLEQFGA